MVAVVIQIELIYDNLKKQIEYRTLHTRELHYLQDKKINRRKAFPSNLNFSRY